MPDQTQTLSEVTLQKLQSEVADSWGSYVTLVTNGFGALYTGNATNAAAAYREIGRSLTEFASDISGRVLAISEGVGTAAERAALRDIGNGLLQQAESMRAAGAESFGRAVSEEANGALKSLNAGRSALRQTCIT